MWRFSFSLGLDPSVLNLPQTPSQMKACLKRQVHWHSPRWSEGTHQCPALGSAAQLWVVPSLPSPPSLPCLPHCSNPPPRTPWGSAVQCWLSSHSVGTWLPAAPAQPAQRRHKASSSSHSYISAGGTPRRQVGGQDSSQQGVALWPPDHAPPPVASRGQHATGTAWKRIPKEGP